VTLEVTRPAAPGPVFYFDLASPEAYLAAERVLQVMPVATEWVPVLAAELPGAPAPADPALIEARAAARGLQAVRRPDPFPADARTAMLAATFAKSIGRVVAFSLAAFRQAFAGGHDLGDPDVVLIAGSACEMHPSAILKAIETEGTRAGLAAATALAAERGVREMPAVWVPGSGVFHGDAGLDAAAAACSGDAA
jgi:2-hydroxychromene-2-carboxylate isomerase